MVIRFRGAPIFLAWFCLLFGIAYYGIGALFLHAYADELASSPALLQAISWLLFRGFAIVFSLFGCYAVCRKRVEVTEQEVRYYRWGMLRRTLPADSVTVYGLVRFGGMSTRLFFTAAEEITDCKTFSRFRRRNAPLIVTVDTNYRKLAQVWKLWDRPPVLTGTLAGNTSLQRDLRVLYEKQT